MKNLKAFFVALAALVASGALLTTKFVADEWDKANVSCDEFAEYSKELGKEQELAYLLQNVVLDKCPETVSMVECWGKADGDLCRYGLHYGKNLGGEHDGVCDKFTPGEDKALPCQTNGGGAEAAVDPTFHPIEEVIASLDEKMAKVAEKKEADIAEAVALEAARAESVMGEALKP